MIKLKVEQFPPSTNVYWRRSGTHMHLSAKARDWKQFIAELCLVEGIIPLLGNVKIEIQIYRKQRDLDNYLKGILDSFIGLAYEDDSQITDMRVTRHKLKKGAKAHMIILIDNAGELAE